MRQPLALPAKGTKRMMKLEELSTPPSPGSAAGSAAESAAESAPEPMPETAAVPLTPQQAAHLSLKFAELEQAKAILLSACHMVAPNAAGFLGVSGPADSPVLLVRIRPTT